MSTYITKHYKGNPDWNIAGLFAHDYFWIPFLTQLKQNNIELPFQYIYGTPRNCKVGGGRNLSMLEQTMQINNLETIDAYEELGVGCRLALSNHLLKKEDYEMDKDLNFLLNHMNNLKGKHGVILSDDGFNNYIANKYPNLQRICSVIRPAIEVGWGNETTDFYNNLCEKYDIVVLNCGFAKDLDNIKKLKYKNKVEVLVNTRCTLNCQLAKQHYDIIAEGYLNTPKNDALDLELRIKDQLLWTKCREIKQRNILEGANFYIEEIQQLLNSGINHFKLEGRNWSIDTIVKDVGYYICDEVMFTRLCKNIMGMDI